MQLVAELALGLCRDRVGPAIDSLKAMIAAVDSDTPPLRLALGADAVHGIAAKFERLRKDMEDWRETAMATAYDA